MNSAATTFQKFIVKIKFLLLIVLCFPAISFAKVATHAEIVQAVKNSPYANEWLKNNADAVANLAINVESGGRTNIYNGSCCTGVLQMNRENIRKYGDGLTRYGGGLTREQYQNASLQTQVNAWARLTSAALRGKNPQKLASMGTFDGRTVTGEMVLACVQLGVGNCGQMLRSGSCKGFADRNGTTICKMADKMGGSTPTGSIGTDGIGGDSGWVSEDNANIHGYRIIDEFLETYENAIEGWNSVFPKYASYLFWLLVFISMIWHFGMMAVRQSDIGEFFAEFTKFIIYTGFFWWILQNGVDMANDIADSFRQLGGQASGGSSQVSPTTILDSGFEILAKTLDKASIWSPVASAIALLISLLILVCFALVAVNMAILIISSWVLIYAGVFFLGFGGSRWTSDMAIGYLKTILNIGAQLFAMVLIVSIGESFAKTYIANLSDVSNIAEMAVMACVAAVLLMLINKVPALIGGLADNSSLSVASSMGHFGAGAAVGAMATAGAALATGGAAALSGVKEMAAGAMAITAATKDGQKQT